MTNTIAELMRCPFCGDKAFFTTSGGVSCERPFCGGMAPGRMRGDAIAAWNTRTPPTSVNNRINDVTRYDPVTVEAGWQPIETAPKDGSEFQGWVDGSGFSGWEPRCRINPDSEAVEIWGRVDYDADGWDTYLHLTVTRWMPLPEAPRNLSGERARRDCR